MSNRVLRELAKLPRDVREFLRDSAREDMARALYTPFQDAFLMRLFRKRALRRFAK